MSLVAVDRERERERKRENDYMLLWSDENERMMIIEAIISN